MIPLISLASFRKGMAMGFAGIFFAMSLALGLMAVGTIFDGGTDGALIEAVLKAINYVVISLAIFELGIVVHREYVAEYDEKQNTDHVLVVLRRTLPRFVSIVCVALVLEGLLMVIKYSQLELAGNLYYPVAIIISAAILLMALGVFLRFSQVVGMEPEQATLPRPGGEEHARPVLPATPSLILR